MIVDPEEELTIFWPEIEVEDRDDYHTPHRRYLELDELLTTKMRLLEQEAERLERAKDVAEGADLDSHTGSCALAEASGDADLAQELIVAHLDASPERAMDCVERGMQDSGLPGTNFIDRIFGEEVDLSRWEILRQSLSWISDESSPSHGQMSLEDFYLSAHETWELLEIWDFLADETTAIQSAVMLSGTWRDPLDLIAHLPVNPPYDPDEEDIKVGRFLGATYGFLCLREHGVVLGESAPTAVDLSSDLETGLLPWLLPAASPENEDVIPELCSVIASLGLSGAPLNESPFHLEPDSEWVEEIRNTAASVNHLLSRSIPDVVHFRHRDVQIVLAEGGENVVAWVGNKKTGVITSFDKEHFIVSAMPSPASAFAAGCAISLYVDLTVDLRRRVGLERQSSGSVTTRRQTYGTTADFDRQMKQVRAGTHSPPEAHYVAPHIRHLVDKRPNRAHVAQAPERLRVRMGPHDTWVTGHMRGLGNVAQVVEWLREYSMLADMLGLLH